MNQILQTENRREKGPVEIGKIIKFFVVAIIIFAIILIGLGIYYLVTNNNTTGGQDQVIDTAPDVNITKQEDKILIEVNSNIVISKIIYKWNDEGENIIEGENSTSLSKQVDLPFGTNILNLTVIDINGKETKFQKEYIVEGDGKPVIELKLTTDNKIKITVQDKTDLQYVNYSWNNDEPIKIEANADNKNLIEQVIEIPLGQNTLKVEAVNIGNVTSSKELEVKGIKSPTLSFKKQGDAIIIRAEDETGLKIIDYTLNGQKYQINYGNKTVIEYKQAIQKGENYMEITAENQDGGKTSKKVKIIN
ncbi:MAG: hypothetical protein HFJ58_05825 [Clostridia bacterium]|nr:hypothetical protein [Clostridia bacterium]